MVDSVKKLHPRTQVRNPVMFVVFVGSLLTTYLFVRDLPTASAADSVFTGLVAVWLWFTVLFANFAEAVAEGRGKAQADTLRKTRSETVGARAARRRVDRRATSSTELHVGDLRRRDRRRADSRRRRRHRGHRVGRRVGDHRRVGAGDPRVGRRPLRGHRRDARAVGPHRRADLGRARRELHRPHDRVGRRRQPAEDAERDRAQHPAGRA